MDAQEQRQRHTVVSNLRRDFTESLNELIPQINAVLATEREDNQKRYRELEVACLDTCTKIAAALNSHPAIWRQDILDEHTALMDCLHITQDDVEQNKVDICRIGDRAQEHIEQLTFWGRLKWLIRGK